MTENEVMVMLSEAIDQDREYKSWHVSTKHLMTFAAMVVAQEREACAKVAEQFEPDEENDFVSYISTAIRFRKA